jgi:hypothetical protein
MTAARAREDWRARRPTRVGRAGARRHARRRAPARTASARPPRRARLRAEPRRDARRRRRARRAAWQPRWSHRDVESERVRVRASSMTRCSSAGRGPRAGHRAARERGEPRPSRCDHDVGASKDGVLALDVAPAQWRARRSRRGRILPRRARTRRGEVVAGPTLTSTAAPASERDEGKREAARGTRDERRPVGDVARGPRPHWSTTCHRRGVDRPAAAFIAQTIAGGERRDVGSARERRVRAPPRGRTRKRRDRLVDRRPRKRRRAARAASMREQCGDDSATAPGPQEGGRTRAAVRPARPRSSMPSARPRDRCPPSARPTPSWRSRDRDGRGGRASGRDLASVSDEHARRARGRRGRRREARP